MQISIDIPEKVLECFIDKARYRVAYGGRASAKSWSFATMLLLKCMESSIRCLCVREIQGSIKDSVHKLLQDQIDRYNLPHFTVLQDSIRYDNNGVQSEIFFKGLKRNISEIKSTENVTICWVEEAQVVSEESLNILIPTIRGKDSEIWFTLNPLHETDAVYKRFIKEPPANAIVKKINYTDNPYFSKELQEEMERQKDSDFDMYRHVWLGECYNIPLGKPVYGTQFNPLLHIKKLTYTESEPLIISFDFGFHNPACIIGQEDDYGRLKILRAFKGKDQKTTDFADRVNRILNTEILNGSKPNPIVYADIQGKAETSAQANDYESLNSKGFYPLSDQKKGTIIDGVIVVQNKLGQLVNGMPGIMINDTGCQELIDSLTFGYCYPKDADGDTSKLKPHKDNVYDHLADALRYICVNRYQIIQSNPDSWREFLDYEGTGGDWSPF